MSTCTICSTRCRGSRRSRRDGYRDPYYGREYAKGHDGFDAEGLEVMTKAYQENLGGALVYEDKQLRDSTEALLDRNPEMMDMALGCLFDFEP